MAAILAGLKAAPATRAAAVGRPSGPRRPHSAHGPPVQGGSEVVVAHRENREDRLTSRLTSRLFYAHHSSVVSRHPVGRVRLRAPGRGRSWTRSTASRSAIASSRATVVARLPDQLHPVHASQTGLRQIAVHVREAPEELDRCHSRLVVSADQVHLARRGADGAGRVSLRGRHRLCPPSARCRVSPAWRRS